MRYFKFIFVMSALLTGNSFGELIYGYDYNIYPINGSEWKDLSGLTFCQSKLTTISDKDDFMVYELRQDEGKEEYNLVPILTMEYRNKYSNNGFSLVHKISFLYDKYVNGDPVDIEGVSCSSDKDGIFLVSENRISVFNAKNKINENDWILKGIYKQGYLLGYFSKYNAFLEGIAVHGNDLWIALERQKRGIAVYKDGDVGNGEYFDLPNNLSLDFRGRPLDVSGLYIENNYIYTLERNASSLCRRNISDKMAVDCIVFYDKENEIKYEDTRFGKSEGIAVDDVFVYVVFDNNGSYVSGTRDNRSRLLKIKKPNKWQ